MATQTLTIREPLPQDLKEKIVHLAVLRSQIHRYAAAFRELSKEVNARLAEQVEVRK
jgi:hypothetical protein